MLELVARGQHQRRRRQARGISGCGAGRRLWRSDSHSWCLSGGGHVQLCQLLDVRHWVDCDVGRYVIQRVKRAAQARTVQTNVCLRVEDATNLRVYIAVDNQHNIQHYLIDI